MTIKQMGAKGGKSKSAKKINAVKANLEKARTALSQKRKKLKEQKG